MTAPIDHTAQALASFSQANGGVHTLADFAAHTADWVTPIARSYRGCMNFNQHFVFFGAWLWNIG